MVVRIAGNTIQTLGGLIERLDGVKLGQHGFKSQNYFGMFRTGFFQLLVACFAFEAFGLLQRVDDRCHLLAAQAVEHSVYLIEQFLFGGPLQPVIVHKPNHRFDAADESVCLRLNLGLLGLILRQLGCRHDGRQKCQSEQPWSGFHRTSLERIKIFITLN